MTEPSRRRLDRRAFLKSSAGAAVVAGPAAAVALGASPAQREAVAARPIATPQTPPPPEPVVAYIHDPRQGVVTITSGTSEATYQDPALTRRLLDLATPGSEGGAADVLAP